MADLTVLVVVICSFICSVYVQQLPGVNQYNPAINTFPSFQPLNKPGLPQPVNGRPQAYRRKPCPRRRMNDEGEEVVTSQDQPLQNSKSLPPVQNDDEFDCDIDLNAVNSAAPEQYAKGSATGLASKPNVGKKVIDLLKDCADNKQKIAKEEPENIVDPQLLKGSRRSMSGPDNNNNAITDKNEEVISKTGNPGVPDVQEGLEIGQGPMSKQNEDQRVCYACSSATNPSCWKPDARTTIKYCRQNQQCVTKSFGEDDSLTVIRDCAYSCVASSVPGVQPKYKQCKLCNDDLCNVHEGSANSAIINTYNLAFILVVAAIKYSL